MDTIQSEIKDRLIKLGIMPQCPGHRCLMYAIQMYHDDPALSVTEEIYPDIGHRQTPEESGSQVERQIRYAVASAQERSDAEVWKKYFPDGKRPTNSELIARISENLSTES